MYPPQALDRTPFGLSGLFSKDSGLFRMLLRGSMFCWERVRIQALQVRASAHEGQGLGIRLPDRRGGAASA